MLATAQYVTVVLKNKAQGRRSLLDANMNAITTKECNNNQACVIITLTQRAVVAVTEYYHRQGWLLHMSAAEPRGIHGSLASPARRRGGKMSLAMPKMRNFRENN